jgi:predicted signal transduction protein with EAL and GGDEF domain
LLEVAPELIKLDRTMTRDIDSDPVRRALARALVTFGNEVGAEVIAEGIETAAELAVLIDLGIAYGQGFHLARPGGLEDLNVLLGVPEVDRRISLSKGIAVPDHAIGAQSLERAANRALYAAKKAGRDRSEVFSGTSNAI